MQNVKVNAKINCESNNMYYMLTCLKNHISTKISNTINDVHSIFYPKSSTKQYCLFTTL